MDPIAMIGYAAMTFIGVVLGLLGAGGSILAVPIMVYLLAVPPTQATGYSLIVVGATALTGSVHYIRRGLAHPRAALAFGLPAIAGVYTSRRVIVPALPDPVFAGVSRDAAVMVVFAAFMLAAAVSMIWGRRGGRHDDGAVRTGPALGALGLGVGLLTGFVGAGGGFLIIPALVVLGGLPIRMAIGTSLIVIAAKCLVGFLGEAQASPSVDWGFLAAVTVLPLAGIVAGTRLNRAIPAATLKPAFGWFVLAIAAYIIARETFLR